MCISYYVIQYSHFKFVLIKKQAARQMSYLSQLGSAITLALLICVVQEWPTLLHNQIVIQFNLVL